MKALFIDVATQKTYIENFGANAIVNAPEIRENLMMITHMAITKQVPVLSLLHMVSDDPELLEKVMDTEIDDATDINEGIGQYNNLEFASLEQIDYMLIKEFINFHQADTIFVYGVPLEMTQKIALKLHDFCEKVWLVADAVKSNEGFEKDACKALKPHGIKSLSTLSLQSYLNL